MGDMHMHNLAKTKFEHVSKAAIKPVVMAALCCATLSACSPGGVVAGTIGAAGAVAGTAVDVVLRANVQPGEVE